MFDAKLTGSRLRLLRVSNGCKQEEIAQALGMRQSNVSGQELGNFTPTLSTLYWYAEHFNVSADYILGLIDEPRPIKKDPSAKAEEPNPIAVTDSIPEVDLQDKESLERFVRAVVGRALMDERTE